MSFASRAWRRLGLLLLTGTLLLPGLSWLDGCGGCADVSDLRDFAVTPPQPCLTLRVAGLCYGIALQGTNGCADSLVLPGNDGTPVSVPPGGAIDFRGPWQIISKQELFTTTDRYSVKATLGTTPITISFTL